MLTVDFRRFPVRPGHRVLDLGCGGGRHAFEVYRRGANVVAFDLDPAELAPVTGMFGAMRQAGEAGPAAGAAAISGDATRMPFRNHTTLSRDPALGRVLNRKFACSPVVACTRETGATRPGRLIHARLRTPRCVEVVVVVVVVVEPITTS